MTYLGELRTNWRALLASTIGHGAGLAASAYIIGTFAPHLIQEFGWSKSDFALLGTATLLTLVCLPVIGRLTDLFGVRRVAVTGAVFLPLSYLALSVFNGELRVFIGIVMLQVVLGTTTTSTVYSRLVAERFELARGLGLAIMASGPAIVGAIGAPLLSDYIDAEGWRAGYRALAIFTAIFGLLALLLIPPHEALTPVMRQKRRTARDYRAIARSPAFWVIAGGIFLCNIPQPLHGLQLKLMLLDNGASAAAASRMISLYAVGVIIGRFVCGLALDRLPAHIVAAVSMALPSIGMFMIASALDAPWALATAVLLMGLSQGAEGDIAGYLVLRHFSVSIYSSVLGPVIAALGIASALGAGLLSLALKFTGGYDLYLALTAIGVLAGSGLFLLLGHSGIGNHHTTG
ncbi:MAG TPA: MFS transporter [Solimonas sp.]|nr:MFS transporter [Solimonas sp.]